MPSYNLSNISTDAPDGIGKEQAKEQTAKYIKKIDELQDILYAQNKYSLLVVVQGQDASGKDGAIKDVFSTLNPQGISVKSFKAPTSVELSHDFLWRVHAEAPTKGQIKIFNRSHYEDVLITRVEGWVDDKTAQRRFEHINAFERLLQQHNTVVLKFFLHTSIKEQEKRFYDRMTDPKKQWKFGAEDLQKIKKADAYRQCYEEAFEKCSPEIPWVIVPADQNWYKEYLIAKTVCEAMEDLNLSYPTIVLDTSNPDVKRILDKYRE